MHQLLVGTTLLAAFLGGVVALLAPCCISVMLPAYFASSFRRPADRVAMTLVFATGVGAIILPIALGASAISAAVTGHHFAVFLTGGVLMAVTGAGLLAGWKPRLPMLGRRPITGHGPASVFALGLFSGAASACCAPVLAGVAVLSGAAGSFPVALAIGVAYVFGMVAPLCLISLVWDQRARETSRRLTTKQIHFGRTQRTILLGTLCAGLLMLAMGALTIVVAFTGPSMPSRGWRVTLAARLQHYAAVATRALSWLPGWVDALVIFGALALLLWWTLKTSGSEAASSSVIAPRDDPADSATPLATKELETVER